ncbi:MAG: cobyric acid synthase [Rubellimicrobium sp.]|nr:cobyric acid synthase [Rubellimicrobium sp.]
MDASAGRPGRGLMIQGTGSNVGKSLIVAGLCRIARRRGISVAPFKPQNMSNNSALTPDGGEISRAQSLQARAAGVVPSVHMNPVLLKPQSESGAQVVVHGRPHSSVAASDYAGLRPALLAPVLDSYRHLADTHDLVVVEGAGSPAEVNLRTNDIANMGFARAADLPVLLVGDIDRGGVIAQIVGTRVVLAPEDAAQVAGFLVNRFRGDPALFADGYDLIGQRTGWRGFGLVPWFEPARLLPPEDGLDLRSLSRRRSGEALTVACLGFPRIANFDDMGPLAAEEGVNLVMVYGGDTIPSEAALVILPGSRAARDDLAFLRAQGWDIDLAAHVRRGGHVLGVGAGYQMLGQRISDPDGLEGTPGESAGLGLLDVTTLVTGEKRLGEVRAVHEDSGIAVEGYSTHMARTDGPDCARPFARVDGRPEGARAASGRVEGTYLHGLFSSGRFRAACLARLGAESEGREHDELVETTLDALADHLERHVDVDGLFALAR